MRGSLGIVVLVHTPSLPVSLHNHHPPPSLFSRHISAGGRGNAVTVGYNAVSLFGGNIAKRVIFLNF